MAVGDVPGRGPGLQALVGMDLSDRCTAVAAVTDPRLNCTHQFDLAGLCVSHAARGTESRQYDIELPPPHDWTVTPRLWRDGELVLEWKLAVGKTRTRSLVSPEPFTEAPWRGGFMKWADATFPPEEAEAAIVLRRSCDIGMGRGMDLEAIPVALDLGRAHDRHLLLDAARRDARRVSQQGLDPRFRRAPRRCSEQSRTPSRARPGLAAPGQRGSSPTSSA